MTGAYLRVERNGKFENIEVEHLTMEERKYHLAGRSEDEILRWLDLVCDKLSEVENKFFEKAESE